MIEVTRDEIEAGAAALRSMACICERGRNQWGPFHVIDPECPICNDEPKQVELVLAAVLPLIGQRLEAKATEEAVTWITAVTMAAGGRLAVPISTYNAARGTELQRYDDPDTQSIVFETPVPDVA